MNKDLISQIAHHFYVHYMKTGGENEGWFPDGFTFNDPIGRQENFTYDECVKIMNCDGWRIWNQLVIEPAGDWVAEMEVTA